METHLSFLKTHIKFLKSFLGSGKAACNGDVSPVPDNEHGFDLKKKKSSAVETHKVPGCCKSSCSAGVQKSSQEPEKSSVMEIHLKVPKKCSRFRDKVSTVAMYLKFLMMFLDSCKGSCCRNHQRKSRAPQQ